MCTLVWPAAQQLVLGHPELVARFGGAVQSHARSSAASCRAIQGWLNQTASSGPDSSTTRASTRFWRRLRIGLTAMLLDDDLDRRLLPDDQVRDLADLAPVAVGVREVLEQVTERREAERRRPLGRGAVQPSGVGEPRGLRQRAQRRGQRRSASSTAAPPMRRVCRIAARPRSVRFSERLGQLALLGGEQPPPGGLTAGVVVELDVGSGTSASHAFMPERRPLPGDAGDQLAPVGAERLERGLERCPRARPRRRAPRST